MVECVDDHDRGQRVELQTMWDEVAELEPGYRSVDSAIDAAVADRDVVARWWFPDVEFDAEGDVGKRVSPGAERDQGVSARTNVGTTVSSLLFDNARRYDRRERSRRIEEQQAAAERFDDEIRVEIAGVYLEAQIAEAQLEFLESQRREFDELGDIVDHRIDRGVEGDYQRRVFEAADARLSRLVTEARQELEQAVAELSGYIDRCVVPAATNAYLRPMELVDDARPHPAVEELERRAEAVEMAAEATERRDHLRLSLIGVGRLYLSPAYEQFPEPEYYTGLSGVWRPDVGGTRRLRSEAESARARALDDEARSLERRVERQRLRYMQLRRAFDERLQAVKSERTESRRRTEAAVRRWQQGVEDWTEVVDAREELIDAELNELELYREMARQFIRHAVSVGVVDVFVESDDE